VVRGIEWFDSDRLAKLADSLIQLAHPHQRESQICVGRRVLWLKSNCLVEFRNGFFLAT
jgi:hypothetical protein